MTEEIKEILEALKPHNNIKEYPLYLNRKQQDLLYDYITNLQREKSDICKNRLAIAIERDRLQQENERLKEDNLLIKSANKILSDNLHNYKSRCEKAIEYIKTHYLKPNEPELENILNGSDEK